MPDAPCGFLLLDKPAGWTSFDVCGFVRKTLSPQKQAGAKRIKIPVGHTGTLDPFATGLLVVAVGRATRLIPYLDKANKTYEATFVLGKTSDTLDPEGEIVDSPLTHIPTWQEIQETINEHFLGTRPQIPPAYSARHINGVRAYSLARQGKDVPLEAKNATLHNYEIGAYAFPNLRLCLTVGAGFYVRSLARDITKHYGGGGYCAVLRRTRVGDVDIGDATSLHEIKPQDILDPSALLTDTPHTFIDPQRQNDFCHGRVIPLPDNSLQAKEGSPLLICVPSGQNGSPRTIGMGELRQGWIAPKVVLVSAGQ